MRMRFNLGQSDSSQVMSLLTHPRQFSAYIKHAGCYDRKNGMRLGEMGYCLNVGIKASCVCGFCVIHYLHLVFGLSI